ncbi:myxosortase-dependent phytase-like phosphatase [Corallococcus carmarthensis]|uniref:Phytase n=1 Tax=Corallococcus carmarthensis TaxID=2316728 RepID=A0A3A8JGN9_9BACT|nr:myxosortase-dependent phytase-like phosphatase [Corallococcus carmarthensis]NOK23342.1 phytase [Corallococcus carmarthensis]RKG94849.1 phytase [Corallococcus carmarthensis]
MRNLSLPALTAVLVSTAAGAQTAPVAVPYTVQTQPGARSGGGTVNDVALWVNPADRAASRLITADQNNGLFTYALDGGEVQAITEGTAASVDVLGGFPLAGGASASLVLSANPTLTGLVPYVMDAAADGGGLTRLSPTASPLDVGVSYGTVRMARGADGSIQAFGGLAAGGLRQFLLTPTDGGVTATPLRDIPAGAVLGLVVDPAYRALYVAQQGQGLYRYGSDADAGTTGTQVVGLGDGGLTSVGRLALYEASGTDGYLLATDPNANTFVVFDRRTLGRVGSFQLVQDGGTDGVEQSRGLVAFSGPLGTAFPEGLFVAHDGVSSSTLGDNLKLTSWGNVARAFSPPLIIVGQQADGGTGQDAGTGKDGGGGVIVNPGDQNPIGGGSGTDDDSGCGCTSTSVPAIATLGLLAMALLGRRRRS